MAGFKRAPDAPRQRGVGRGKLDIAPGPSNQSNCHRHETRNCSCCSRLRSSGATIGNLPGSHLLHPRGNGARTGRTDKIIAKNITGRIDHQRHGRRPGVGVGRPWPGSELVHPDKRCLSLWLVGEHAIAVQIQVSMGWAAKQRRGQTSTASLEAASLLRTPRGREIVSDVPSWVR